ncbi:MAG: hypothetical protein H6683_06015 [Deltaproteobacteria bacterium]|nr:hypothetical protein [Deltaproteobacteria bacterium]
MERIYAVFGAFVMVGLLLTWSTGCDLPDIEPGDEPDAPSLNSDAAATGADDDDAAAGTLPDGTTAGPPSEALEACDGLAIADECIIETPFGDLLDGTCEDIEGDVACVPLDGPPEGEPPAV